ncbi:MAG TPA: hypothetical protein VF103_04840 [Polyangiaceae bacterium]
MAVSTPAYAKPPFPGIVKEKLDLGCAPPCTLCHTSPSPNASNAEQPFVNDLYAWAKVPEPDLVISESTLPGLLKQLETGECPPDAASACTTTPCGPCDADGTGGPDITELRAGDNPNNSDELHCPKYGCGAHIAPLRPTRPIDGSAALATLGTVAVLVRRWRRR